MDIDKQTILDLLHEQGDDDKAEQAEQQLPDKVDHEQHADLLSKLGIDAHELLQNLESRF
jgi:predicted PhzF superfamily epimerase YddE/YHI9